MASADIKRAKPAEIEAHFGLRIAFGVCIDRTFYDVQDDGSATYIGPEFQMPLPTATIFQGSGINIIAFPEEVLIVLDEFFFELAWDYYFISKSRRQNQ